MIIILPRIFLLNLQHLDYSVTSSEQMSSTIDGISQFWFNSSAVCNGVSPFSSRRLSASGYAFTSALITQKLHPPRHAQCRTALPSLHFAETMSSEIRRSLANTFGGMQFIHATWRAALSSMSRYFDFCLASSRGR
mmetsp:Transcript_17928/g.25986  ORF Transcript_17928/g.25986 Transcript_17928/m.25986 type:complete len:136 (-) Transcript_17928:321-728(-)